MVCCVSVVRRSNLRIRDFFRIDELNDENRLQDGDRYQDHEGPDDDKFRPGACAKAPLWIGWEADALTIRPEEGNTTLCERISSNVHHATKEDANKDEM